MCVRVGAACLCLNVKLFECRTFVAGGKTVPLCDAFSISLSTCLHERLHLNPGILPEYKCFGQFQRLEHDCLCGSVCLKQTKKSQINRELSSLDLFVATIHILLIWLLCKVTYPPPGHNWVVKDLVQGLNSSNLAMQGFALTTFWSVAQSLNHWPTTAYNAYP